MVDHVKKFGRNEDGAIAVESVLWFPVYATVAALLVDATSLVLTQTRMQQAAADAARMVAIGRLSESEASDLITDRAVSTEEYNVDINIEDYIVSATVTMDFENMIGLGLLSKRDGTFGTTAYFRVEPTFEIEDDEYDDDDDDDDNDDDNDDDDDDDEDSNNDDDDDDDSNNDDDDDDDD